MPPKPSSKKSTVQPEPASSKKEKPTPKPATKEVNPKEIKEKKGEKAIKKGETLDNKQLENVLVTSGILDAYECTTNLK